MDIYEVVTKLVGPIDPVGETNTDDARYKNLEVMTELVNRLLTDIDYVAANKDRPEFSMSRAGKHASEAFDIYGITND